MDTGASPWSRQRGASSDENGLVGAAVEASRVDEADLSEQVEEARDGKVGSDARCNHARHGPRIVFRRE